MADVQDEGPVGSAGSVAQAGGLGFGGSAAELAADAARAPQSRLARREEEVDAEPDLRPVAPRQPTGATPST